MKPCAVTFAAALAFVFSTVAAVPAAAAPSPAPATGVGRSSKDPKVDPAALATLKRAGDAMLALDRYQAECWTTRRFEAHSDGAPTTPPRYEMATLTAVKPGQMRYDKWEMSAPVTTKAEDFGAWKRAKPDPVDVFASDGESFWRQFDGVSRKKLRVKPEELYTPTEFWEGFYHADRSPYESTIHPMMGGKLIEARRDGAALVDGVKCNKVFTHIQQPLSPVSAGVTMEFWTIWYISVSDGLVRRHVQAVGTRAPRVPERRAFVTDSVVRGLRVNRAVQPEPARFTYTPPTGVEVRVEQPALPLLAAGKPAPEFTATTADGKAVKLSDFRGKVVVLDFWATWCGPCVASMPHLQKLVKRLQTEGLPVVAVSLDDFEGREPFEKWVKAHPEFDALTFAHTGRGPDEEFGGKAYRVNAIPTQYVIDARGVIRAAFEGFDDESDELEIAIRAALKP